MRSVALRSTILLFALFVAVSALGCIATPTGEGHCAPTALSTHLDHLHSLSLGALTFSTLLLALTVATLVVLVFTFAPLARTRVPALALCGPPPLRHRLSLTLRSPPIF